MIEQRIRAAARMARIPPYLFAEIDRRVAEKRAAGVDVIALDIGDPDLATPLNMAGGAGRAVGPLEGVATGLDRGLAQSLA